MIPTPRAPYLSVPNREQVSSYHVVTKANNHSESLTLLQKFQTGSEIVI